MKNKTVSGLMLTLLLTIPSIFVNMVSAYLPYTPSPLTTYLVYSTSNGSSYISVYLTLPHTGFDISWGTVVRDGDNFCVNSEIWDLGAGFQVITTFSHTYDLGVLVRGDYTFTFKAWNTTLRSLNFTSLADRIEPATFQLFESPTNKPLFKVAWKPDGGYALLVARARQGYGSEIFRFDENSYTLLLNDSSIIIQGGPAWKPDGSYALFTAHYYANQNHRYKVLKYDGLSFSTIQEGGTDDMCDIAWKPDGSHALIVGGDWRRIIWKYDGINFTRIYEDSVFSKFLLVDWEPDGNYVMITDFFYGIFKFNGTTLTKLASYDGLEISAIEWSADGNYALITIYSNKHPVVLKFNGTKFTDVTSQTGTKNNLCGISSSITGGTLIVGGSGTVLKYDGINFTILTKGEYGGLVDVDWKPGSNCALSVGGKTVLLITLITGVAKTWTVDDDGPADFHTIQEAVNAAGPGDTIYVYNGTYHENVVVNKTVSLIGEGRETTVIGGSGVGNVTKVTVDNVTIGGFTVRNSGGWFNSGIALSNAKNCNVSRNDVTNNTVGIWLRNSSSNYISENRIMKNEAGLLLLNSSNNRLKDNIMTNNTYNFYVAGETLDHYINDVDTSNTINGKPVIYWINKQNQTIPQEAGYVAVINSTNITVKVLDLRNNWAGLVLAYAQNTVITNNNIRDNVGGISLYECSNNSISGNSLENNSIAISLDLSSNNSVCKNNIRNNWIGVHLHLASDNKLYHNNFINNTQQVSYPSHDYGNFWDDGYPSGGNYWSDYEERYPEAKELDDSGIWDTPYVIDENNQDNYPLMGPWSPPIERKVGVKVGDWAKYEVAYNYTTNDPNYQPQFSDIEYFKTEVLSVTGTNVTFQATTYYRNGTETSQFIGMNVSVYDPYNPISAPPFFIEAILFIPANLTVGDTLPLWQHHERYIIKATLVRTYAGAEREVNYVYHRIFFYGMVLPSLERIIFERIMHIFWDRATGVLVEGNETTIITNLTKGYVTKTFTQMTMKETNIWSAYMHELAVTSSPMTGITFTINGTPQTTPYTESLLEGFYTLEMPETHGEYVWSHWLEDGDTNRIKTVTMNTDISLTAVFTPLDTTPPTVSIVSPENKTYTVEDVPLTFTVSESTSWIGYSLDGQANITIAGNTTLTGLSDGMHSLVVYASDITGNMGSSGVVYFTIQTTAIDTTSPSISIVSPENKTYATTDISLTLTVDEIVSWMAYSLDGQANVTITGNTTLSGLSDGSHNLIVYAIDAAGNTGASEMVYFSITTLQPDPFPWWILGAIAGIVVIGIALGTFFLRRRKSVKS